MVGGEKEKGRVNKSTDTYLHQGRAPKGKKRKRKNSFTIPSHDKSLRSLFLLLLQQQLARARDEA